jgi:hypothetical protein
MIAEQSHEIRFNAHAFAFDINAMHEKFIAIGG